MTKQSLSCPQCGATMDYIEKENKLLCKYCGHSELIVKEIPKTYITEKEKYKAYHDAKYEAQAKYEKELASNKRKRKFLTIVIIIAVIAVIGFIGSLRPGSPYIKDPFEYCKIEFTGNNGEGKAIVTSSGKDSTVYNNLRITVTPKEHLSNDSEITVNITSSEYRLGTPNKTVTVTGLSPLIEDISQIDPDIIEAFYERSMMNEEDMGYCKDPIHTHYAMILLVKGNKNIIFDVYKATVHAEDKQADVFWVRKYENVYKVNDGISPYKANRVDVFGIVQSLFANEQEFGTYNGISKYYLGAFTGFYYYDDVVTAIKSNFSEYTKYQELKLDN